MQALREGDERHLPPRDRGPVRKYVRDIVDSRRSVAEYFLPLALVILARDQALAATLPALRRRGLTALPVHYLGKAATFNLLYAFPLLLLGSHGGTISDIAKPIAWAFTIWGTALYLWAGGLYLVQFRRVLREPVQV